MKTEISELISISKYYGNNKEFAIAGGGNTSYKEIDKIWIKASGQSLAGINEESLVVLDREQLREISRKEYAEDPFTRENQVKDDLMRSTIEPGKNLRPSVETSLHELIAYKFVVHLHPTLINGLLCSRHARNMTQNLFGNKVLFVAYTEPGYTLFKKLEAEILIYREKFAEDPQIIFLENHGAFVSADSTEEIKNIYSEIIHKIGEQVKPPGENIELPYNTVMNAVLPAIRMMLSEENPKVVRYRHNTLISMYYKNQQEFHKISLPVIPDQIVYCKTKYLYIEHSSDSEKILDSFRMQLDHFVKEYGYIPRIIVIKDMGVFAVDENYASAETALDVYEDFIKICYYSSFFGGTKFFSPEESAFIDHWEVEDYRRKVSYGIRSKNNVQNKTAIVTGGAQGFGAGIAEALFKLNMNVIIADLNEEKGQALENRLNATNSSSHAVFVKTDVADPVSVKNLIIHAVKEFGGLDIMVSNAGILKAGGLDEMTPDVFSEITNVNYTGYFLCTKYASEVMKLQNLEKQEYFTDIIQINSKSGLRGSNRNFAYAGSKFGGIGLTQSFALELAPFRIKVNSICPGNFYEGPLWSDPQTGLFVQYLKAGKVTGAKTIDEVRKFYEDLVPLKRGCRLEDVMKALLYVVEQKYETGQVIPVTGGQVM